MLIVKDFKKLEEHGFKKLHDWNGNGIWERMLETDDNNNWISLLVNPYSTIHAENEMFIYGFSPGEDNVEMDMVARIDEVFEMVADGTIEYVNDTKKEDK